MLLYFMQFRWSKFVFVIKKTRKSFSKSDHIAIWVFYNSICDNHSSTYSREENHSKIRQSKINSSSVAGPMGQMNRRPSVWCSKYYFFMISCKILCKKAFNSFYYFFYKITKIKLMSFEYSKSIKSVKRIILGTSDTWSTIHLSCHPSDPA